MGNTTSAVTAAVARDSIFDAASVKRAFDWKSASGLVLKEMQSQIRLLDPLFIEEMIDLADGGGQKYLDSAKSAEKAMRDHCPLRDWWHPRELLSDLVTESVERLRREGINLTFSDREVLHAVLSGVHAAQAIDIPRISLEYHKRIMFPWKSVMNSYLSAKSPDAAAERVADFSIPFSDAPKGNAITAPLVAPLAIKGHQRRMREVFEMRYHVSHMSLEDVINLADVGVAWNNGYAQSFLNALELVRLLPEAQSRILMAGYTISRITVSTLIERHTDELMNVIGKDGIDEVRNILIGVCVAVQSKSYVDHWQEYSMRDYETLIGPWTVYIDMRAEDIANEDADVV